MVHQANHYTDVACCLKQMVKRDSTREVQRHNAVHFLPLIRPSIVSSLTLSLSLSLPLTAFPLLPSLWIIINILN